jgi:tetratricopeptide (TPR) repeat protein
MPLAPVPTSAAPAHADPAPAPLGDPWVELNNEATGDLTAGDPAAALAKLERCHAAVPGNTVFAGNLAEALVRVAKLEHERGALEPAIEHLARAVQLGEERADIAVLRRILERWRRELELGEDDWTEGSGRFELAFDTDRRDILHHSHEVLEHLELAYDDLVRWFGEDPYPDGPAIRVVLYDPEDFERLTGLGDWAAGVFDGVVRVSVSDLVRGHGWREVLVHELVHAFVQALSGPSVPGWLNEGLAQMHEGRAGEPARARERLRGGELFPLERLAGSLAAWQDAAAIARAYAESLLFVEYLRATYGDEALRRMLLSLRDGRKPEESFQAFTQVALEVAFQDWSASLVR